MALTEAERRALAETEAQRPKTVQDAEGMSTGRSAEDIIKLATFGDTTTKDQSAKGLGFVRFKSPSSRNRMSTSSD